MKIFYTNSKSPDYQLVLMDFELKMYTSEKLLRFNANINLCVCLKKFSIQIINHQIIKTPVDELQKCNSKKLKDLIQISNFKMIDQILGHTSPPLHVSLWWAFYF